MDKRLSNCNFIKAILMLTVVLYHSVLFWGGSWFSGVETIVFPSKALGVFSKILGSFPNYSFALVSGYLFCYLKTEKKAYSQFIPFIKKKFTRLIVPYIFLSIFWTIPFALFIFNYDFKMIFEKFVLMIYSPDQLWFIIMLFNVFWLSFFMSRIWTKSPFWGFITVVASFLIGAVCRELVPDLFQIWTSLMYLPYFWLGFYLRQKSESLLWKIPSSVYIIIAALLFVALNFTQSFGSIINVILRNVSKPILSVAVFMLLQRLATHINYHNKVFDFISSNSMVVYLFHLQPIYYTICLFNGVLNPYVHAGINLVVSLTVSFLLAFLLKKNKVTRFLLGEK